MVRDAMSVYELDSMELYDAYAKGRDPVEVVAEGREALAQRLQVDHGLQQEDAYYAADQILEAAEQMIGGESRP
jgi:hypothetical protein